MSRLRPYFLYQVELLLHLRSIAPPFFIQDHLNPHKGAFNKMFATGAADASYTLRSTSTPPTQLWSRFGSQRILITSRQARMIINVHHYSVPSAFRAVYVYFVPDETMRCPIAGIDLDRLTLFSLTTPSSCLSRLIPQPEFGWATPDPAQLPPSNIVGCNDHPHMVSTGIPQSSYAHQGHKNDT